MAAEKKRGCGYRKIGGLYLCADGPGESCDRLPIPLEICPTCHHGVKQTRGWTWVKPEILGGAHRGVLASHCVPCCVCTPALLGEKVGLLWIDETPEEFIRESIEMGISRRVAAIPRGFKLGEPVLVAHPRACTEYKGMFESGGEEPGEFSLIKSLMKRTAGIFHIFRPIRIEKILPDNASPEEIREWQDRGVTVVLLPFDDKDHQGSVRGRE